MTPMNWRVQGEEVWEPEPVSSSESAGDLDSKWRELYRAARRIKELAPWDWMEEVDVFGIEFPGINEIGFVSVMGMLGEHLSVSAYLGEDTLGKFLHIQDMPACPEAVDRLLEMRQLMVSFEDRDALQEEDREVICGLGLSFRGRQAWPLFRSYRPGYLPWFLEPDEIELLTISLQQAANVVPRFKDDSLPEPDGTDGGFSCLMRVPLRTGDGWIWTEEVREFPIEAEETLFVEICHDEVRELSDLPGRATAIELDFSVMPGGVDNEGERPSYSYLLIAVGEDTGLIFGYELLQAIEGVPAMLREIPGAALAVFKRAGFRPSRIDIQSFRLHQLLAPLFKAVEIDVSFCESLPAAEAAKKSLWETLGK